MPPFPAVSEVLRGRVCIRVEAVGAIATPPFLTSAIECPSQATTTIS